MGIFDILDVALRKTLDTVNGNINHEHCISHSQKEDEIIILKTDLGFGFVSTNKANKQSCKLHYMFYGQHEPKRLTPYYETIDELLEIWQNDRLLSKVQQVQNINRSSVYTLYSNRSGEVCTVKNIFNYVYKEKQALADIKKLRPSVSIVQFEEEIKITPWFSVLIFKYKENNFYGVYYWAVDAKRYVLGNTPEDVKEYKSLASKKISEKQIFVRKLFKTFAKYEFPAGNIP